MVLAKAARVAEAKNEQSGCSCTLVKTYPLVVKKVSRLIPFITWLFNQIDRFELWRRHINPAPKFRSSQDRTSLGNTHALELA